MANNTTLNTGTGGDVIQTVDNTTYKTQVVAVADSTGANKVAVNASGQVPVTVATALPAGTNNIGLVQPTPASITGTISGTTSVTLNTLGIGHVIFYRTGTFTGTLISEVSIDGTNWLTIKDGTGASTAITSATGAAYQDQFAGAGVWTLGAYAYFRIRCSAYTSGTLTVTIVGSIQPLPYINTAQAPYGTPMVTVGGFGYAGAFGALINGGLAGAWAVGGCTASGGAVTSNPVRIGAKAAITNPAAVADATASNIMTDKMGRQVVVQGHVRDLVGKQATTITTTAATTIVTAGAAGVFNDLTRLTVTNGSATATTVTLSDGTYSEVHNLPANGGFVIPFNPPMPATNAAVAWTLTLGTAVSSVYVGVTYVKNL